MCPNIKINNDEIFNIYKATADNMYKSYWDYEKLEKKLSHLKNDGALTYDDLEFISSKEIWPAFSEWYRWPAKTEIESSLQKTYKLFTSINEDNIEELFNTLFNIFKHIELVSIILRSVDPDNFGMYSPPVAYYLNVPRGPNYWVEYKNYLDILNHYRKEFKFEKAAYVDMFIWAISTAQQNKLDIRPYTDKDTIKVKDVIVNNVISEILADKIKNKTDYEIAEFFLKYNLHDLAARSAGIAFESLILKKCAECRVAVKISEYKKYIDLDDRIEALCKKLGRNKKDLISVKNLRNSASHPNVTRFTKQNVEFMLATINNINRWYSRF